jgi:hypothetical protein
VNEGIWPSGGGLKSPGHRPCLLLGARLPCRCHKVRLGGCDACELSCHLSFKALTGQPVRNRTAIAILEGLHRREPRPTLLEWDLG